MSIVWSGLAPHPPIVIPDIGQDHLFKVATTIRSCEDLARDFVSTGCDILVVISPHTPRPRRGITIYCDPMHKGDFRNFGHAGLKYRFLNSLDWIQEFTRHYSRVTLFEETLLDHGALVPLHFIHEAGWSGKTAIIGLPWDSGEIPAIGQAIKNTCQGATRVGIIASGDMSHCHHESAPSGYHPSGKKFDDLFVEMVQSLNWKNIEDKTQVLRETACEDVFDSCLLTWLSTEYNQDHHRFFSYECPFGVGYTVTKFHGPH